MACDWKAVERADGKRHSLWVTVQTRIAHLVPKLLFCLLALDLPTDIPLLPSSSIFKLPSSITRTSKAVGGNEAANVHRRLNPTKWHFTARTAPRQPASSSPSNSKTSQIMSPSPKMPKSPAQATPMACDCRILKASKKATP